MFNNIFGELKYEYGWNGETTLDWFGETIAVDLVVSVAYPNILTWPIRNR